MKNGGQTLDRLSLPSRIIEINLKPGYLASCKQHPHPKVSVLNRDTVYLDWLVIRC